MTLKQLEYIELIKKAWESNPNTRFGKLVFQADLSQASLDQTEDDEYFNNFKKTYSL